jgi:hypothetical protein
MAMNPERIKIPTETNPERTKIATRIKHQTPAMITKSEAMKSPGIIPGDFFCPGKYTRHNHFAKLS